MKTYLITYDLLPDNHELAVTSIIKTMGQWAHPLEKVWLVKTYYSRQEVFDRLRIADGTMATKLLIIQVTDDWISLNLPPEVVKWMQGGL